MTLTAFMHAAERARLEAVVAMTQWLASPSHPAQLTRDMRAIEQQLPTLPGASVTILNPGFFADNYLRIALGMTAQLGLYLNFVGDSRNAPPANEDMARAAAAVLADPGRHDGRRYRITGPDLIGVTEIVAILGRVLGRRVRAINAPEWLLDKVAAYRREPRYDMAVLRHYPVDHRQGGFAFCAPTTDVLEVTGTPAESFETTAARYAAQPAAQRNTANFRRSFNEFMLAPFWHGYDHDRQERDLGIARLSAPKYAMADGRWKADRMAQFAAPHVVPYFAKAS